MKLKKNNNNLLTPSHLLFPNFKKLTDIQLSYYAGFIDGDGSLFVRIVPQKSKFPFKINVSIGFYQHTRHYYFLQEIKKIFGERGHIRKRPCSDMSDFICSDTQLIKDFLTIIYPYLKLKKSQSLLILKIIQEYKEFYSCSDSLDYSHNFGNIFLSYKQVAFLEVCKKIDKVASLNSSKKRKYTYDYVLDTFINKI